MKSYTIDTAAAWSGTITTWQDGDVFRETNTDAVADSIADRLGYLKTKADGAAYIAASQTFSGLTTWAGASAGVVISGDFGLTTSSLDVGSAATFADTVAFNAGPITFASAPSFNGGLGADYSTLADADSTIGTPTRFEYRVPQLTASRNYGLDSTTNTLAVISASAQGWVELVHSTTKQRVRIVRMRTADAFTVTIKGTAGTWRVAAWGGSVTSLDTSV